MKRPGGSAPSARIDKRFCRPRFAIALKSRRTNAEFR
jgi:hypothetical protein